MTVISPPATCWHLECFGPLRARRADHVIERFRTQKTASLLAILAIRGAQTREKLCDLLWPDAAPEAARNSLSAALSALRREFGDDNICADRFRVSLAPNAFSTDVALFDEASKNGDLATATSLYRDHLLPGSYEESLVALAREYEEKARAVFETHLQQLEASGSYTEAVSTARRALSLFPGTSLWFSAMMRAHHAMQQYDAALEVFKELSNFARRENELVPDAARHLARQIRRERENHNPAPPLVVPSSGNESSTRNPKSEDVCVSTPISVEAAPEIAAHLPLTWTSFFGREDEIEQLQELLRHERFITLTGMGGTGKTRLVIQLARRVVSEWNNRVYFVPLAALSDDELLFVTIRDALQLPAAPDLPPLQQIVAALADAPALLLLDNFEQLVSGAARLQQLRAALPHTTFVVTSRVLLNLPGECEWAVPTLPTPSADSDYEECPSTALFFNRAQMARPDFAITSQNARDVSELCRRLDGIPLALELAAARVRVLAPAQILERLEKQLDFLQTREHGVPERQRTLRATIEWSYNQLPPEQGEFFNRLSVFRGGWTLEAAEQVCALSPEEELEVLDTLERLREYSMLLTYDTPGGTRFRALEVLREWGASRLAPDADLQRCLREHHFKYFLQLIEGANDAASLIARRDELEAESANFRAALSWALEREDADAANDATRLAGALCPWWEHRAFYSEGREWTLRVLRKEGEVDAKWRARLLCGAGSISVCCGDLMVAQSLLEEGLALCRAQNDRWSEAFALHRLSLVTMLRGQIARAITQARQSLDIAREIGDPSLLLGAFIALSWSLFNDFQHEEAQHVFHECLALCESLGIARLAAVNKAFLGYSLLLQGRAAEATRCCDEGVEQAYSGSHDDWCIGLSQAVRGLVARETGDFVRARTLCVLSLNCFDRMGTRWEVASALNDCAMLACDMDRFSVSARIFGAADALAARIGYRLVPSITCLRERRMEILQSELGDNLPREMQAGANLSLDEVIEQLQAD